MRQARYRHTVALDVYDQLGDEPPRFNLKANMSEDAATVAARIRDVTHLADIQKRHAGDAGSALTSLRVSIEQLGILVFQMSGVEAKEARGFSLAESSLPVIVLNAKDAVTARLFTLTHELAHVMLHSGGICDLGDNDVEVYCNAVAGSALVPADVLREALAASVHRSGTTWNDDELEGLASRFTVSPEVIMRRLLDAGLTTQKAYRSKRDEYLKRYVETSGKQSQAPVPQPVLVLSRAGLGFARLVLEGYHQDRLTLSDVSNYLNVNLKHLPEIERRVTKRVLSLRTGV
jgi:Zn-dependent peptidase ImmA (M78 family)